MTTEQPKPARRRVPGRRARRRDDPRVQGRRARPPRQAAGRRALARRVLRRAAAHARLPAGGRAARRAHPGRGQRAVGAGRRRGRHLQAARRPGGDLPAGAGPVPGRRRRSPTAGSASAPATPGSCSPTCWASAKVRNYDGSWTEWGNSVRVPIATGHRARVGMTGVDDAHAASAARRAGRGLRRGRAAGPAAAAAGAVPGAARAARALRRRGATMEQVPECQSPLFLAVEVEPGRSTGRGAPVLLRPAGGAHHPRVRLDHAHRAGRRAGRRRAGRARRLLHRARAGPGREPAAAARDGRDAGPDQEAGARRRR